jgi:CheY-like chemotaxis protein
VAQPRTLRVVIAEDAAIFREGRVRLIEDSGHQVCAAVGDGEALAAAVAEHRPSTARAPQWLTYECLLRTPTRGYALR